MVGTLLSTKTMKIQIHLLHIAKKNFTSDNEQIQLQRTERDLLGSLDLRHSDIYMEIPFHE